MTMWDRRSGGSGCHRAPRWAPSSSTTMTCAACATASRTGPITWWAWSTAGWPACGPIAGIASGDATNSPVSSTERGIDMNDIDALAQALALAITAETEEQSQRAVALADQLAAGMCET